jgi:hypothetical protein
MARNLLLKSAVSYLIDSGIIFRKLARELL